MGVIPYISHIGMYRPKGSVFGLKTLCPFWSGIGYVFRGNYGSVHEWTYLAFQFQMNKDEIEICEFEMHLEIFFVFALTW